MRLLFRQNIMIAMHGTGQNSIKLLASFGIILCQAIVVIDHTTAVLLKVSYYYICSTLYVINGKYNNTLLVS